jgi:hypothetical protein
LNRQPIYTPTLHSTNLLARINYCVCQFDFLLEKKNFISLTGATAAAIESHPTECLHLIAL